jgi:allantoinase
MPRKVLPPPHGLDQSPDIPNWSWAEYGLRCGMPRLLAAFAERGLPVTCALNAGVIEAYPRLAESILAAGWEFMGHGLHQRSIQSETSESELLHKALDLIAGFTGRPVDGWLGPGLRETQQTPDLLAEAKVRYVCDWVLDDLPCWMNTTSGSLLCMPYTLELNDSVIFAVEHHSSDEFPRRLANTLECFDQELPGAPRILTVALHPHLIGVPHRFVELGRMLDTLMARSDVAFLTGRQIFDWFAAAEPAPSA